MMTNALARTPLYDWHVAHGGRMVDFAGWSMPVQYKSIADEHNATRNAVGVFDISHMGRLRFEGSDAIHFLDSIVTRRVTDLKPDQIRYGLVCNDDGGILDDVLVYAGSADESRPAGMVVNASNREKIVAWLQDRLPAGVPLSDDPFQTAMIAVQGPAAIKAVDPLLELDAPITSMRYYPCASGRFDGHEILVSRTG